MSDTTSAGIGAGAQGAGGAVHLVGGILQGNAARQQGAYQNRIAQINAQLTTMQAKDARMRGDIESSQMVQRGEQIVSGQRAAAGAGGVDPNSGSAAQSQASTRAISQLDALTISHNAQLEAIGYNLQGQNILAGGRMANIAGKNTQSMDILTGGLKFGNSIMQAGSNYSHLQPRVPVQNPTLPSEAQPQVNESNWRNPEDAPPLDEGGDRSESNWAP